MKILNTTTLYKGRLVKLTLDELSIGKKRIFREVIHHPGSSAVIPQLSNGKILMIRQYRHPAKKYILEIPAGGIEKGETPKQCAMRELKEEVGYRAGRLIKFFTFYPSPGYSTERLHLFLATDLRAVSANLEADELIRLKALYLDEAVRLIKTGKIIDAKTIIGLILLFNKCST